MLEIIYQDEWLVAVNKPQAGWYIEAGLIGMKKWW
jgi:23S rRNA-/tRNA-specific pseudouridylate synthase